MFVGSHNGGFAAPDLFMVLYDWFKRFGTERLVYSLMHPKIWTVYPPLAFMAERTGAIAAHPQMALAALDRDASILVYPGGAQDVFRPYSQRHQIYLAERKGLIKIAYVDVCYGHIRHQMQQDLNLLIAKQSGDRPSCSWN